MGTRTRSMALAAAFCAALLTAAPASAAGPTSTPPRPTDTAPTSEFGPLGKWMLKEHCAFPDDCPISDWLGHPYDGKTLDEPINVILVDRSSPTPHQAVEKLTAAMERAGFPSRAGHSSGYHALLPDAHGTPTPHRQQPHASDHAFADAPFFAPLIDHGRVFGPARFAGGFVWTAALSAERPGLYHEPDGSWSFTHDYVSFDSARDKLCTAVVVTGAGRCGAAVDLGNAYDRGSVTTGDHDGRAAVIDLG
ncbi:hypothetical protein AB0O91_37515 [Kitasatospora sp. NPDC089797]|uniref:hypothetical protein n=1 Tax=Kitasatospora sp. NPDC089797 TaxID=3155298 RepID=UPI00343276C9